MSESAVWYCCLWKRMISWNRAQRPWASDGSSPDSATGCYLWCRSLIQFSHRQLVTLSAYVKGVRVSCASSWAALWAAIVIFTLVIDLLAKLTTSTPDISLQGLGSRLNLGNWWILWLRNTWDLLISIWFVKFTAAKSVSWNLELKCRNFSSWEWIISEPVRTTVCWHIIISSSSLISVHCHSKERYPALWTWNIKHPGWIGNDLIQYFWSVCCFDGYDSLHVA